MFCVLNKKMILLKKNKYRKLFLVGLSAIYLLQSELHLKYEKMTDNMQLLHNGTVPLFVQDPYTDVYLL